MSLPHAGPYHVTIQTPFGDVVLSYRCSSGLTAPYPKGYRIVSMPPGIEADPSAEDFFHALDFEEILSKVWLRAHGKL